MGERQTLVRPGGYLGRYGPSCGHKAEEPVGVPWPYTKSCSQLGAPRWPSATPQQHLCSFGSCFFSFLLGAWRLKLGPWSILNRSFVGPDPSSPLHCAPPLLCHLPNARVGWGKTSSTQHPYDGKWLFGKPKIPHQNSGEREFLSSSN